MFYIIIRIVRALSLVNSCIYMRLWKHGCDITRILFGYVFSDSRFDWLVENMSVYQKKTVSIKNFPSVVSFICRIILEKAKESNRGPFFHVSIASFKHEGELGEFSIVMQTLDYVSGLHNCLGFSQLPLVVSKGYGNMENVLYCFNLTFGFA